MWAVAPSPHQWFDQPTGRDYAFRLMLWRCLRSSMARIRTAERNVLSAQVRGTVSRVESPFRSRGFGALFAAESISIAGDLVCKVVVMMLVLPALDQNCGPRWCTP